jgi:hypothetical protein
MIQTQRLAMRSANNYKKINLFIAFFIALICATGLFLIYQSKTKNHLEQNLIQKTAQRNFHTENQPADVQISNKANTFLQKIKESLRQPKDFPFQPVWSNEVYNPDRQFDKNYQKALKKHVTLRNFYTSEVRFSSEFLELHKLLADYGFENDPIISIRLFTNLRMLEMLRKPLDADPALMNPHLKKSITKQYNDLKYHVINVVALNYQIDSPDFLESYLKIRPDEGFGTPDTRIEINEPLLIK